MNPQAKQNNASNALHTFRLHQPEFMSIQTRNGLVSEILKEVKFHIDPKVKYSNIFDTHINFLSHMIGTLNLKGFNINPSIMVSNLIDNVTYAKWRLNKALKSHDTVKTAKIFKGKVDNSYQLTKRLSQSEALVYKTNIMTGLNSIMEELKPSKWKFKTRYYQENYQKLTILCSLITIITMQAIESKDYHIE